MRTPISIALLCLLTAAACEIDEPCDPGYELKAGLCQKVVAGGADAAATATTMCIDKPGPDAGASDAAAPAAPTGEFGRPCTDDTNHSECAEPAPLCFKQQGAASGFCSAINCNIYCNVCPATWTCFDLSLVQPGSPHGCVKL